MSRIIVEDIEATEMIDGRLDHLFDRFLIGGIEANRKGLVAVFGCNALCGFCPHVRDNDADTVLHQPTNYADTDSPSTLLRSLPCLLVHA